MKNNGILIYLNNSPLVNSGKKPVNHERKMVIDKTKNHDLAAICVSNNYFSLSQETVGWGGKDSKR